MLEVLVVDDEPLARARLIKGVEASGRAAVVGEAGSGAQAVKAIVACAPALVLLDVEMPEGDGFSVLEAAIDLPSVPEFVFVTAYDAHAVAAFDYGAVDYLLKPVAFDRLHRALDRAAERLRLRGAGARSERLAALVDRLKDRAARGPEEDSLWLRDGGRTLRVPVREVLFLAADRDYVHVRTETRSLHTRRTLASFETEMSDDFVRIHRSVIVRTSAVDAVFARASGHQAVRLSDGTELPIGRSYRKRARAAFAGG